MRLEDAAGLLEFELANRDWFEKTVEARKEEFYTIAGAIAHVRECLDAYAGGTMHPCVMVDAEGNIAGRLNLRFIDAVQGCGEIGYRIAEPHCGLGWASASVRHMQQLAYGTWHLSSLVAYASVENHASARVLEKNGFVRQELIRDRSFVQRRKLDAYRYRHKAVWSSS
ncbi:MAG TPA: GNAT family N-acetyltransferase [Burkholderiaceae bacterium]